MSSFTMGFRKVRGPEHRKDKRLPLPIFTVKVDGTLCETVNWSLGGLLIAGYAGARSPEDPVEISIKIKDGTADFRMNIAARVVRVDPDGKHLAIRFEQMSTVIYDFFERCFSQRFSGRRS